MEDIMKVLESLRACSKEKRACEKCQYYRRVLCRDDMIRDSADTIENLLNENAALHQIIEKQSAMNKMLVDSAMKGGE